MEGSTLFEWADRLKALRDRKEALEGELKQVNMDIDNADWHLSNLMAESETQNFTRAGTMFCLTTKTRANAAPGRKDELFDALRAEGYGDMITETVNANSLSSFVKEQTGGLDVVYGGGLKADNAEMLASIPEIDGGLIALTRFTGEIGFYPQEYIEIIKLYLGK